ncbi:MAG: PfkB family carbohydrate kinase [Proteobacteria bacterium]|nr:PfkB family carbohydrate kinase [Pseudomonadota bacterium]
MTRILVTGTLAFDDIGLTATPWADADRNIKLDHLHRQFGGCAGNLSYTLKLLGDDPVPLAQVGGVDFEPYRQHLQALGINLRAIRIIDSMMCSRGLVLTDPSGDQFTAFFPGPAEAEDISVQLSLVRIEDFDGAIIAPDLPGKMLALRQAIGGLPAMWCPGQYSEQLTPTMVEGCAAGLDMLVLNRRELEHLYRVIDPAWLDKAVATIIITDGPRPVEVRSAAHRNVYDVPRVVSPIDPTGCGDAFAATMFHHFLRDRVLNDARPNAATAIKAACRVAAACLQTRGGQNHSI